MALMTPGSIMGYGGDTWYDQGANTGIFTPQQQYQQYTNAWMKFKLQESLILAAPKPAAKPECEEFAWLRRRVEEVSWNPVKTPSVLLVT